MVVNHSMVVNHGGQTGGEEELNVKMTSKERNVQFQQWHKNKAAMDKKSMRHVSLYTCLHITLCSGLSMLNSYRLDRCQANTQRYVRPPDPRTSAPPSHVCLEETGHAFDLSPLDLPTRSPN